MTAAPRPLSLLAVLLLAAFVAACHEEGDIKVLSLTFTGNRTVSSGDLMRVLTTQPSGWAPWAKTTYFNRAEFAADLKRIEQTYADRGYPEARVADVNVQFTAKRDGVRIGLRIEEGEPTVVDQVELSGFDVLPDRAMRVVERARQQTGRAHDRRAWVEAMDLAQRLLHNEGYPYATVAVTDRATADPHRIVVTLTATPGPRSYFGQVAIVGNKDVDQAVIARALSFATGQLYRERQVIESQRRLQTLQVFELATIEPHPDAAKHSTNVPLTVTVAEAPSQRATLRLGYGSEEKGRVAAEWAHLNLLGGAETAGVSGKWSSLERDARVSFGEPAFFLGASAELTAEALRDNEPAYLSRNTGGRVTLIRPFGTRSDLPGSAATTVTVTFTHEFLSYQIKSDSLANPAFRTQLIALGLDPETGKGTGTVGAVSLDLRRETIDARPDPRRGYQAQLRLEHASPALGGTFRYHEIGAQFSRYTPLGPHQRLATRVRVSTLSAASDAAVPFSARYFLGGSTSLRGWGRYEVSPLSPGGEPLGGRTRFDFSQEWRLDFTERLAGVIFVDAGNVWPGDWSVRLGQLRYDVGPGLRYRTPVGALRVDVGYQINPIAGLFVNGVSSLRRWRIHFGIGEAF